MGSNNNNNNNNLQEIIDKATTTANKAVDFDNQNNYEESIKQYNNI